MVHSEIDRTNIIDNDRIAVLGAGNTGLGLAGYLSLEGFNVSLYNRTFSKIRDIDKAGGFEVKGLFEGFARLHSVTDDPRIAIAKRGVIIIATSATGHASIAESIVDKLSPGQLILLMPGRTGGALEFYNVLKKKGRENEILIGEAQSNLFISTSENSTSVQISGEKEFVKVSAMPAITNRDYIERLEQFPLRLKPTADVMETSMNNFGALLRPVPVLFSAGIIESKGGGFNHFYDGISESVGQYIEKMDQERLRVANYYTDSPIDIISWMKESYNVEGNNLCECVRNTAAYKDSMAPTSLNHIYLKEGLSAGLVPMSHLGQLAGVMTPIIDSTIQIASNLTQQQYLDTGRTVKKMGLEGMDIQQVKDYVKLGVHRSS